MQNLNMMIIQDTILGWGDLEGENLVTRKNSMYVNTVQHICTLYVQYNQEGGGNANIYGKNLFRLQTCC